MRVKSIVCGTPFGSVSGRMPSRANTPAVNEAGVRMTEVRKHYDELLARHYSWMLGDYETNVRKYMDFFKTHLLVPLLSKRAIDLGCGTGFQCMALAGMGFKVVGIDRSLPLLDELKRRSNGHSVRAVQGDITEFQTSAAQLPVEIITCMGDALTHLDSFDKVASLFDKIYRSLEKGGVTVLSFRDNLRELKGAERMIPVRSDDKRIMTAFIEFAGNHVIVNDMIYTKEGSGWSVEKGSYKKLRIGAQWASRQLEKCGFRIMWEGTEDGFTEIIAEK